MSQELRRKVFNVFKPDEALHPNDPRYVECSKERGSDDLIDNLADTIRLSQEPTSQLLSGHRGCGKTTELFRLQQDLLINEPRHFVVYCEVDQYIDLNDVEYTDVLLAMVRQLGMDAKAKGIRLEPIKLKAFWDDLKSILTAIVEPKDVEFEIGNTKLGFDIKRNPDNRQRVREHLRPRVKTFLEAVNEVIQNAEQAFKSQEHGKYTGLAIIIDNLDRVLRNPIPNSNRTSHDALFVDAADHLCNVACHVIYTVPPALLYSSNGAKLPGLYRTQPQVLPMIPVATRTGDVNEQGLAKLVEAVKDRLLYAGATSVDAFDSEQTIRQLCVTSGGYVRSLMTLAQSSTSRARDLPITSAVVEQTIQRARDGYMRSIRSSQQWQLLRQVAETKQIAETEDYLQLLDNFAVLEYLDADGPWYDVNPVVREAREFKA